MVTNFTSKDICNIIKACSQSGVTELCLAELTLKFNRSGAETPPEEVLTPQPQVPLYVEDLDPRDTPDLPSEQASATVESPIGLMTSEQKTTLEEIRVNQLMMDDPEAYEEYIVDSHLNRQREAGLGEETRHRRIE